MAMRETIFQKTIHPSTLCYLAGIGVAAIIFLCDRAGLLAPLYDSINPPTANEVEALRESRHLVSLFLTELGILIVTSLCSTVFHMREMKAQVVADRAEVMTRAEEDKERKRSLASGQAELSAEEFLATTSLPELTGVYILHNVSQDSYYVGQSVRVIQRVRQHLTGHGNGDIYADYKYGNDFTVKTISLADSGYLCIDDLERDMIDAYDAFSCGYNKTRGNSGR